MYRTSDLYVAAGLVIASGKSPVMELSGGLAFCNFDDPAIEPFIGMLNRGELSVDVRKLRIEHIALKKRVFARIDKKGQQNEKPASD